MREGFVYAGNLILDRVRRIDRLPRRSELAAIRSVSRSTGGVCSSAIGMKKLAPDMPVQVCGVAGSDAEGDFILSEFARAGVETGGVLRRGETSFTDVYEETSANCRTFFFFGGANDTFDVDDVDCENLPGRIFHISYPLLLKALDAPDAEYGTRMARLLSRVRRAGLLVSMDVVSEDSDRYQSVVWPSLKYTDYLTVNELEAARITGVPLTREDGSLIEENMRPALKRMLELGVTRRAIIHAPAGAFGLDASGEYACESGRLLPPGFIGGTVGAGDAFCAGALLAAYRGLSVADALRCGHASAIQSLRADSPTGSMIPMEQALAAYDGLPVRA